MRVTSKGRVTIPQSVRRQLGIEPGDEIVFTIRGDEVVMRPTTGAGRLLVARLTGAATSDDVTGTDDVLRLTRS